jgi:hypothetical protein
MFLVCQPDALASGEGGNPILADLTPLLKRKMPLGKPGEKSGLAGVPWPLS